MLRPSPNHGTLWLLVKISFYVAPYPILKTAQCAFSLYSLDDLFLIKHLLGISGKHPAMLQSISVHKYPPMSIARYSFIQLSELEQRKVKTLAQGLTWEHRIHTRILLVESTKL